MHHIFSLFASIFPWARSTRASYACAFVPMTLPHLPPELADLRPLHTSAWKSHSESIGGFAGYLICHSAVTLSHGAVLSGERLLLGRKGRLAMGPDNFEELGYIGYGSPWAGIVEVFSQAEEEMERVRQRSRLRELTSDLRVLHRWRSCELDPVTVGLN